MAQGKNADDLVAFYPIRLKLMPRLNKMPTMDQELESLEVTVNQKNQIEGNIPVIDFKSPTFSDPEQDRILMTVTGHESNSAINCEAKYNFFTCQVYPSLVNLENSGITAIKITVSDNGPSIKEPPNVIEFEIRINFIEFT